MNISSGEKTRKLDASNTLASSEKQTCKLTTIGQLSARTPRKFKKLRRWIMKTPQSKYSLALHLPTQKSEMNPMY